ncbi:hypothetical protein [Embleya sp. NPDC059237]|uniref:hypothetical protein n=1 Tax=Embleya sp. NPDC059237 TaxID=3346784 RepID=UPI0036BE16CE
MSAYKLYAAYDHNQAGQLTAVNNETPTDRREFGDAGMLIDTALAYLLGPTQEIVVAGAEAEGSPAAAVQAALREWAGRELLSQRIQDAERKAVALGDGVYRLAWDPARGRVTVRTVDPGFYFPVFDDDADPADYPTRVHLAWEIPEDPHTGTRARVRRITYELGAIRPATHSTVDGGESPLREIVVDDQGAVVAPGDTADPDTGLITRAYPWAPTIRTHLTCHLTDAEWFLDDLRTHHDIDHLPLDKARFRIRSDGEVLAGLDLRCDFIPIVHITNSIPGEDHWGVSTLARPTQLLDEIAGTDTDSSSASATTGSPILALAGATTRIDRATGRPETLTVTPGAVYNLGETGRLDVVDTSNQLSELRTHVFDLRQRLASITRIPGAAMGTVDATRIPSGYLLDVSLRPLDALVSSMRLARTHKYSLLFRFVQRLHQAGHAWPAGETLHAELRFGPHTPTDKAAILDQVCLGVQANVLSLETGLRMLQAAGFPIDDVAEEVRLIQGRSFDAASRLADATGDAGAVRTYLGLPDVEPEVPAGGAPEFTSRDAQAAAEETSPGTADEDDS